MGNNVEIKKSKDYLEAVLMDQDNSALAEFLLPNCLALTDYGIAFGQEEIAMDLNFFFQSIDVKSIKFSEQMHCADTTIITFSERCQHIGEFCGVEATGKDFIFNATIALRWQEGKIREYSLTPDVNGMLNQLTDNNTATKIMLALSESNNRCYTLLTKLYAFVHEKGLCLTKQQLKCLALHFEGYSAVVSARILNCSIETVRTHMKNIRELYRNGFLGNIENWFKQQGLYSYMRRYAKLMR